MCKGKVREASGLGLSLSSFFLAEFSEDGNCKEVDSAAGYWRRDGGACMDFVNWVGRGGGS